MVIKDGKESDQAPQAKAEKQEYGSEAPREAGGLISTKPGWRLRERLAREDGRPSDGGQHPAGVPDKTMRVPPPKHPEDWGPR